MRIIVAGPRDWTDVHRVWKVLFDEIRRVDLLIQGGAAGVDAIAKDWAQRHYRSYTTFEAQWDVYGAAAGPLRNKEMARCAADTEGGLRPEPGRLIAFARESGISTGTGNMIGQALAHGLEVKVFYEQGEGMTYTRPAKPPKRKSQR